MDGLGIKKIYIEIMNKLLGLLLLIFFSINIFVVKNLNIWTLLVPVLGILLLLSTEDVAIKLIAFLYYIVMFILVGQKIIEFNFMPQAKALLDISDNLFYWILSGHPHAIRLLICYPSYVLSNFYDIDLNLGFTYLGILVLMMIYFSICKIIYKFIWRRNIISKRIKYILTLIPLLILSFIMNGRLIFSFFGFVIIIDIFMDSFKYNLELSINVILKYFFGLILTMVSSGTMTVSIIYTLLMLYIINYKKINNKKFRKKIMFFIILISPIIYNIGKYFIFMLNRNIKYFGGGFLGIINMLEHGLGKIFILNKWILLLGIFLGLILFSCNIIYIKKRVKKSDNKLPIILATNISLYGILFGFSTGLMMIPPIIIYILLSI